MLITLCYVYLWLRCRSSYALLIRNCVHRFHRTSSFTFCKRHQEQGKRTHSGAPSPGEEKFCLQVGNKAFLIDGAQLFEDLNKWKLLVGSVCEGDLESRSITFITESAPLPGGALSDRSHTPIQALKLFEYCRPLARFHEDSSRLLAEASIDHFSELGIAFLEDRLQMDNGSLPHRITSVHLREPLVTKEDEHKQSFSLVETKTALDLVLTSDRTPVKEMGVGESTELQDPDSSKSPTDRRPKQEASSEHLHLHLSSCHECLELENCTIESVKFASAENIPELPDDNTSLEDNPEASSHKKSSNLNVSGKPPNILVYGSSSSPEKFEQVKTLLYHCFDACRYVLYPLPEEQAIRAPWMDNCLLLVLVDEEHLPPSVHKHFTSYLEKGGKVLGLSSSFTFGNVVLKRKSELQGAVQDLVFDGPNGNQICLHAMASGLVYEEDLTESCDQAVQLDKWGHLNNDDQDLIMIRQPYGDHGGEAVLCQVRLEVAPDSLMDHDKGTFDFLKLSNPQRHEVLTQILISLGLECEVSSPPSLTPVYLLSTCKDVRPDVQQWIESLVKDGLIKSSKMSLQVIDSHKDGLDVTPSLAPLIIGEDFLFEDFSLEEYKENLRTETLGKTVLFSEVTTTTFNLLDGLMSHQPEEVGLIAIAGRQTQGKGRGGNVWLSPKGCALMTLHVSIPLSSPLGQRIAFVQHLMSLAVVEAVRSAPGYEDIELKVKWPNDIYYSNLMKLGGVLVNSTLMGNTFHILIGCGVNVTNSNPTICINDLISEHNKRYKANLQPLRVDTLIARTVTALEALINTFQLIGPSGVLPMYYKYWVHSGQQVRLGGEDGPLAWIVGVDDCGFLQVLQEGKDVITVHPDGNSFDMIRNLIIPKR